MLKLRRRSLRIIADYDDPELGRFRGPGLTRAFTPPGSVRTPRANTMASRRFTGARAINPPPLRRGDGWGGADVCARPYKAFKVGDL